MRAFSGKSILNGVAIGKLRVYRKAAAQIQPVSQLSPPEELSRFNAALAEAQEQLAALYETALAQVGEEHAAIFQIHQMMLEDEDYLDAAHEAIEGGATAEYAALTTGETFAVMFAQMDDEYMKARSTDVRDISQRLCDVLTGASGGAELTEPSILVADDLTPSETVQLDKSKLLGFVTRHGSSNSHTAILARTMNIPALIGVDISEDWDGLPAVLDGYSGQVILEPDDALLAQMEAVRQRDLQAAAALQELKGQPNVTLDGRTINLYANIGSLKDVDAVLANDAGGIGLFRTEFLYLDAQDFPTEEAQFQIYKQVAQAMGGRKVIFRTLDIGADKQVDYFGLAKEDNPALGYRAIRICLTQTDIFKTQLRALLRSSAFGKVSIMFPMITSLWEVQKAKEVLAQCRAELEAEGVELGEVELGIMIETPAAALVADQLAQEVEFFSLGTNDLTQYTLAIDRQNPKLDAFYDPHHPAVLELIRMTVEAGHRHGCWVGICGELGADAALTETFLRLGLDELSVSPSAVLPLRKRVRELNLTKG